MKKKAKKSVYEIATEKIIALLEEGTNPWQKPWTSIGGMPPMNYATKHPYRGINFFILSILYEDPYFLTWNQIKKMGGSVRKGAKSEMVFFWSWIELNKDGKKCKPGEKVDKKIPFLRYYRVFNAPDIEGIEFEYPDQPELKDHQKIAKCEAIVADTNATIISKDKSGAYYSPLRDHINMPEIGQFNSPEQYYSTLFHELTHWTGHESRLNRLRRDGKIAAFGDTEYSKEELVAEMGASFLCFHTGIENKTINNSAAYLKAWIDVLKGDSKLVVQAAAAAQKAVDLILGFAGGDEAGG